MAKLQNVQTVSTTEAAKILDLSHTTIVRLVNNGTLEAHRATLAPNSPWRVHVDSIREFQRKRANR